MLMMADSTKSGSMNTTWSVEADWDKFPLVLPYLPRNNPLAIAIKSNDVKTAATIIKNRDVGINGIIGDYPWPIHMAVLDNNKEACRLLLRYNCEVNIGADKGEPPLHLATTDIVAMDIFEDLLAAGASVNQQTNMQETPLHVAAQHDEMDKLKRLLQEPQLDVHLCDCKGDNALHKLLLSNKLANPVLIEGIQLLMERGIDVDAQNKQGFTALMDSAFAMHIGCIVFMIRAGANPFLQDKEGNSFLHHLQALLSHEVHDKDFLDVLETCIDCHIQASHLLNVKNLRGNTPFLLAIRYGSIQVVEKCIEYGADVNVQNNLGWSCLSHAIFTNSEEKVNLLLKMGAELNLTNVKGESMLHWGYNVNILKSLLETKGDCMVNVKDSNGLTPLHYWVYTDRIEDVDILVQHGADVNMRDNFGSTPLHFAAWHCSSTVSKFLETKGADPFLEDAMGHRPCDVTDLNQYHRPPCPLFPSLAEAINNEFNERSPSDTESDEDDLDVPNPNSTSVSEESFITKAIDKENAITSIPELLNSSVYGMVQWQDEALQIKQAVTSLLEKMLVVIKDLDERFAATLLNTGSSSEGTLISQPHEFDFICYLDNFSSICTPHDDYRQIYGYCQAKLKKIEHYELYSEFFEGNRMLDAEIVRDKLKRLFEIAFHQGYPWKDSMLYFEQMADLADKPTTTAIFRWVGCRYKSLEISVDIVPALYFPGYWPSLIDTSSLTLLTEDINKAGCALLLQNQSISDDAICNENTYLRISAAPSEVALFRTLPLTVKRSYALAKIMLQPDICPPRFFRNEWSILPAGKYISSYMLKTSLLYVLGEQLDLLESAHSQCASNDYLFVKELTIKIFRYLHLRTCCRSLNPYFLNCLENTDIFSFQYKEYLLENPSNDQDFSCAMETQYGRRKYFIELIIQILDRLVSCSDP